MGKQATVEQTRSKHRWTVEDYHRMGEVGLLREESRVELIDGEVVDMAPIGSRHGGKVNKLTRMLMESAGRQAVVAVQNPILLGPHDEPQPDIALLRWRDDFYESGHPMPADVLLLVEVSDTTLDYDRKIKLPRYAACGIATVWIVNLPECGLEVYTEPEQGGYARMETVRAGRLELPGLAGQSINVGALFSESDGAT